MYGARMSRQADIYREMASYALRKKNSRLDPWIDLRIIKLLCAKGQDSSSILFPSSMLTVMRRLGGMPDQPYGTCSQWP